MFIKGVRISLGGLLGEEEKKKIYLPVVEDYAKGVKFPAGKQDLLKVIKKNQAPKSIIKALIQFQEKKYQSMTEVAKEAGRINSIIV